MAAIMEREKRLYNSRCSFLAGLMLGDVERVSGTELWLVVDRNACQKVEPRDGEFV